jgi:hypothetical protein|uniref:Uncharacterized protein n=1 Tax=Leptospirillum ferriphilum TaxID=178606 RepID=A0A2I2MDW3_9BACT
MLVSFFRKGKNRKNSFSTGIPAFLCVLVPECSLPIFILSGFEKDFFPGEESSNDRVSKKKPPPGGLPTEAMSVSPADGKNGQRVFMSITNRYRTSPLTVRS